MNKEYHVSEAAVAQRLSDEENKRKKGSWVRFPVRASFKKYKNRDRHKL